MRLRPRRAGADDGDDAGTDDDGDDDDDDDDDGGIAGATVGGAIGAEYAYMPTRTRRSVGAPASRSASISA